MHFMGKYMVISPTILPKILPRWTNMYPLCTVREVGGQKQRSRTQSFPFSHILSLCQFVEARKSGIF